MSSREQVGSKYKIAVIAPEKDAKTSSAPAALLQQLLQQLECLGDFFQENLLRDHTDFVYSLDFLLICYAFIVQVHLQMASFKTKTPWLRSNAHTKPATK